MTKKLSELTADQLESLARDPNPKIRQLALSEWIARASHDDWLRFKMSGRLM